MAMPKVVVIVCVCVCGGNCRMTERNVKGVPWTARYLSFAPTAISLPNSSFIRFHLILPIFIRRLPSSYHVHLSLPPQWCSTLSVLLKNSTPTKERYQKRVPSNEISISHPHYKPSSTLPTASRLLGAAGLAAIQHRLELLCWYIFKGKRERILLLNLAA